MLEAVEAFPNPWANSASSAASGRKSKGRGKGRGGDGKGRGKGSGGYGGRSGRERQRSQVCDIDPARRTELESQLHAFRQGVEPGARPRPGDQVQILRVLGPDRRHLEGRVGEVVGSAPLPALQSGGGAVTVHFAGDGALFGAEGLNLTVSADELQVVEAVRPLGEASLEFPKAVNGFDGLDRKAVHEIAEGMGLITQSYGEGKDRYITVYRCAEGTDPPAKQSRGSTEDVSRHDTTSQSVPAGVSHSGMLLDTESRAALLETLAPLPDGWLAFAERMIVCQGPLQQPTDCDRRSVSESMKEAVAALHVNDKAELRVVSVGRSEREMAVGVLGLPAFDRNPHVLVAAAPGARGASAESIKSWTAYNGDVLVLRGSIVEWAKQAQDVNDATLQRQSLELE